MSRGFAHCNEHLLHFLWFNEAGTHLGPPSTVATPSTRSFYTPGPCHRYWQKGRGLQQLQGISAWAVGWLPDTTAAGSPHLCPSLSHQYFAISPPFIPCYLQFAISQLHLSLFCPQNQAPLTNTLQEKLQQSEKDEECPQLPSSPPPAKAADLKSLRGCFFLTKELQNKVD